MTNRLWGLLLILAATWGASFMAYEIGLRSLPVQVLVMYRIVGAALFLWVLALIQGWKIPRGTVWFGLLILGLLNNVIPFTLIAWGQQYIESGLAAILNGATAIFGALLAPFFFNNEQLTWNKLTGVIIGFIGVSVAIGIDSLLHLDPRNIGQWAIIGASVSYALGGIWAKKTIKLEPRVIALGMLTASSVVMIALNWRVLGTAVMIPSLHGGLAAIYLAVISTALAYLLFYKVLAEAGVSYLTLVTLLIPPFAILLGAVFLGERLHSSALIGFSLVALGMVFIDGRLVRR